MSVFLYALLFSDVSALPSVFGVNEGYSIGKFNYASPRDFIPLKSWSFKPYTYCEPMLGELDVGEIGVSAGPGCFVNEPRGPPSSHFMSWRPSTNETSQVELSSALFPSTGTGVQVNDCYPSFFPPLGDSHTALLFGYCNYYNYEYTRSFLLHVDRKASVAKLLWATERLTDNPDPGGRPEVNAYDPHLGVFYYSCVAPMPGSTYWSNALGVSKIDGDSADFLGYAWFPIGVRLNGLQYDTNKRRLIGFMEDTSSADINQLMVELTVSMATHSINVKVVNDMPGLWSQLGSSYYVNDTAHSSGFEPASQAWVVMSTGCYNITASEKFVMCRDNLGTEKVQVFTPAGDRLYAYNQTTNYNDGLPLPWTSIIVLSNKVVQSDENPHIPS